MPPCLPHSLPRGGSRVGGACRRRRHGSPSGAIMSDSSGPATTGWRAMARLIATRPRSSSACHVASSRERQVGRPDPHPIRAVRGSQRSTAPLARSRPASGWNACLDTSVSIVRTSCCARSAVASAVLPQHKLACVQSPHVGQLEYQCATKVGGIAVSVDVAYEISVPDVTVLSYSGVP